MKFLHLFLCPISPDDFIAAEYVLDLRVISRRIPHHVFLQNAQLFPKNFRDQAWN